MRSRPSKRTLLVMCEAQTATMAGAWLLDDGGIEPAQHGFPNERNRNMHTNFSATWTHGCCTEVLKRKYILVPYAYCAACCRTPPWLYQCSSLQTSNHVAPSSAQQAVTTLPLLAWLSDALLDTANSSATVLHTPMSSSSSFCTSSTCAGSATLSARWQADTAVAVLPWRLSM
jgi:hypothetical protein